MGGIAHIGFADLEGRIDVAVSGGHLCPGVPLVNESFVIGHVLVDQVIQLDEDTFLAHLQELIRSQAALNEYVRVIVGVQLYIALLLILGEIGTGDHFQLHIGLLLHLFVHSSFLKFEHGVAGTHIDRDLYGFCQGESNAFTLLPGTITLCSIRLIVVLAGFTPHAVRRGLPIVISASCQHGKCHGCRHQKRRQFLSLHSSSSLIFMCRPERSSLSRISGNISR